MPGADQIEAEPGLRGFTVVTDDGVRLSGEQAGSGTPVVLLHGLTATRRYVLMGSRMLERSGHRVISYDARGHGRSQPALRADAYGYERLARDLEQLLDALELERAVIAGASMGAHTALSLALAHPRRVSALALITPAFDPAAEGAPEGDQHALAAWDALARGLREGGVEGFVAAYDLTSVPARWRATLETVLRQRLGEHEHPLAVADALEAVPRSRPFERLAELEQIRAPTIVVADRDEADPAHPLAVAEAYAAHIPGARLFVEEPGRSPLPWQGAQLSRLIGELAQRA
jgi:pimeloyl-ACP methyl ester carboxylesterase